MLRSFEMEREHEQHRSRHDERQTQELAHGEPAAKQVPKLRIGQSYEFD